VGSFRGRAKHCDAGMQGIRFVRNLLASSAQFNYDIIIISQFTYIEQVTVTSNQNS